MIKELDIDVDYVETLLSERSQARLAKDFTKADDIRDLLLSKHVILHDGRDGTVWEVNKHFS